MRLEPIFSVPIDESDVLLAAIHWIREVGFDNAISLQAPRLSHS